MMLLLCDMAFMLSCCEIAFVRFVVKLPSCDLSVGCHLCAICEIALVRFVAKSPCCEIAFVRFVCANCF
jgi:hypothetical protein